MEKLSKLECYRDLACELVWMTVVDWRKAVRVPKGHKKYKKAQSVKRECEEFLLSDDNIWLALLPGIDGKRLLEKLKAEEGM